MITLSLQTWLGGLSYTQDSDDFTGWITNVQESERTAWGEVYEERFVVEMPEISEEDRDTTIEQVAEEYAAAIPEDTLIMRY